MYHCVLVILQRSHFDDNTLTSFGAKTSTSTVRLRDDLRVKKVEEKEESRRTED